MARLSHLMLLRIPHGSVVYYSLNMRNHQIEVGVDSGSWPELSYGNDDMIRLERDAIGGREAYVRFRG